MVNQHVGATSKFLIYLDRDTIRSDDQWMWIPARDCIPEDVYIIQIQRDIEKEKKKDITGCGWYAPNCGIE